MDSSEPSSGPYADVLQRELRQIEAFYSDWRTPSELSSRQRPLLRACYEMAFVIFLWEQSLPGIPSWAKAYLRTLKTDTLLLLDSATLGNVKSFHLFLRSCIEDLIRYVFYYHHEIEHQILQRESSKYESIEDLFKWTRNHPFYNKKARPLVNTACQRLSDQHSQLSRTIHSTIVDKAQVVRGISAIHEPFPRLQAEVRRVKLIRNGIVFLLSSFHLEYYRRLGQGKRVSINAGLSDEQVRFLTGLK